MKNIILSLLAAALCIDAAACAAIPSLQGEPEDVGRRMGVNAVAYNQAYGHGIADQILLNVLRARDRLPLYYLSMSGINVGSNIAEQHQFSIGQVGLGNGHPDWGIAGVQEQRTTTTSPSYALNPFGPAKDQFSATQFRPATFELFQHYWSQNWPKDILVLVMTQRISIASDADGRALENSPHTLRGDCTSPNTLQADPTTSADCRFVARVAQMLDASPGPELVPCPEKGTADCDAIVRNGGVEYRLKLRAFDDMVYYLGALLRGETGPEYVAHVTVRPGGVYPVDTYSDDQWRLIQRSVPLFHVSATRQGNDGSFAAEVRYLGQNYVAGPTNDRVCITSGDGSDCVSGDPSAQVLSLLTQIAVLSQNPPAQQAPTQVIVQAQPH